MGATFETPLIGKTNRTPECVSFRFERPEGFSYEAGQFFFITLEGRGDLRKPFSFSSSPTEEGLELTTRLTGSHFKTKLGELSIGDAVACEGPYGRFTLRKGITQAAFLAGGIGITPIRSIIRYALDAGLAIDMVLLYSNRSLEQIAFHDELDAMANSTGHLRAMHCVGDAPASWTGRRGRIAKETVEAEVADHAERTFYVSGPARMVDAMRAILRELGVTRERLVFESFTGYESAHSR